MAATSFWHTVLPAEPNAAWLADVRQLAVEAEPRRQRADYDTGSITEKEAYLLRALVEYLHSRIVIEIGTFIGASTMAMATGLSVLAVFTCDYSNDCLPAIYPVHTYPRQTSTQMLRDLRARQVTADLCFFDGVINAADVTLLKHVTHKGTVYAFHDYNYGPKLRKSGWTTVPRKGIGNVNLLKPRLSRHVLVDPLPETTLALLVPEALL